jgi:hypothetical protein
MSLQFAVAFRERRDQAGSRLFRGMIQRLPADGQAMRFVPYAPPARLSDQSSGGIAARTEGNLKWSLRIQKFRLAMWEPNI